MKRVIGLGVLCALLSGNEIERIESIVNDVTQLRQEYERCQQRLGEAESGAKRASEAAIENERLGYEAKIKTLEEALENAQEEERRAQRSLEHASAQIAQLNQLVSEQKRHIAALNGAVPKPAEPRTVVQTICPDPNPFPKLMMKDAAPAAEPSPAAVADEAGESVYFKASPFRLNADADIYDAPGGEVVAHWEERTSFTSNEKRSGWVKITGYFVDKKWQPSGEESLWIEETLVYKR